MLLPASCGCQYYLVCGFITVLSVSVVTLPSLLSVSNLLPSPYNEPVIIFRSHQDNLRILNHICRVFFTIYNIQKFQGLGCGCLFREPLFSLPQSLCLSLSLLLLISALLFLFFFIFQKHIVASRLRGYDLKLCSRVE